jgi:dissimilatory sulfite reductase (desulfoviridin) alpha/beta subunit|tara:strand:- start:176 stop:418 length:243 start_codon:yes stop_codon:yes gene_type:complete
MFHPFQEDTSEMTVAQIYDKVAELTKKYFQSNNPQIKEQIGTFIEYYKQEALVKEAKEKLEQEKNQQNGDLDLDKLINIS